MDPSHQLGEGVNAGELQRLTLSELRERAEALDARIREHLKRDARPRATVVMQCAVCEQRGTAADTRERAAEWAFRHREENAGHGAFREITMRPYQW
ncbi:DUF7848 domain-containing protein [Streptomyces sp. 6N223]|uniref:DUF7848 domain-containing protein n=1 Tax=Streptomyces sp. 6N223 TaxID=3457412 RepID=UPI003FD296CF